MTKGKKRSTLAVQNVAAPNGVCSSSGNSGVVVTDVSTNENKTLEGRAAVIRNKLDNTYRQIGFLNQQIRDLKRLYKRGKKYNKHDFGYNILIKRSITRGIKMMYCHYANIKVAELERITKQLKEARSMASDTSDGDRVLFWRVACFKVFIIDLPCCC
ncbi:hypothetical protein MRX96_038544 [Rhipicephalus microplus]